MSKRSQMKHSEIEIRSPGFPRRWNLGIVSPVTGLCPGELDSQDEPTLGRELKGFVSRTVAVRCS